MSKCYVCDKEFTEDVLLGIYFDIKQPICNHCLQIQIADDIAGALVNMKPKQHVNKIVVQVQRRSMRAFYKKILDKLFREIKENEKR